MFFFEVDLNKQIEKLLFLKRIKNLIILQNSKNF
jgi:hypothetical protein